jgi:hypothetical protein
MRKQASERDALLIVFVFDRPANAFVVIVTRLDRRHNFPPPDHRSNMQGQTDIEDQSPHVAQEMSQKLTFHPPLGSMVFCMYADGQENNSLLAPMPSFDQTDPSQCNPADQGQAQRYLQVHPTHVKSLTRLNNSVLQ